MILTCELRTPFCSKQPFFRLQLLSVVTHVTLTVTVPLTRIVESHFKRYADLGKRDWPADFPNFFELILEMLRGDREELLVGLQVTLFFFFFLAL